MGENLSAVSEVWGKRATKKQSVSNTCLLFGRLSLDLVSVAKLKVPSIQILFPFLSPSQIYIMGTKIILALLASGPSKLMHFKILASRKHEINDFSPSSSPDLNSAVK